MEIEGKSAVVTGAATGIGRASAVAIATRGARQVFLIDIDAEHLAETTELVKAAGAEPVVKRFDLSDSAGMARLFAEIEAQGGLDILHNNAGIMSGPPAFPETPLHRIPLLISINLTAVVLGTRLAIEIMRKRGGGAIVNTSSQGALRYGRNQVAGRSELIEDAPYAASKAGVQMFTQTCLPLHAMYNIRVNSICPGIVDTPILASTGGATPADWVRPMIARVKPLTPERIAEAVITLIQDESRAGDYIHIEN
jgi:NAD(P)-dependent dehydrogenase (short-subunit alcohol dehydrogenase family)